MATTLTADDAKQSLNGHVAAKGAEINAKYGPEIGWQELQQILEDKAFCRYPCKIEVSAEFLQPGELAYPAARGEKPEDGFTMYVHPFFMTQLSSVPHLVLYQLVVVNYGEFASSDDAETFGANALGLSRDDYYNALCELADQIGGCS